MGKGVLPLIILHNQEFIDRKEAKTDIEDRAYTFGDGVYEVIRIYNGKYFMLEEHLNRLQFSVNEIFISYDINQENLMENLFQLLDKNKIEDGAVYVQVSRGIAPRKHPFPSNTKPELYAFPISVQRPLEEQQHGVKTILLPDLRWLRCDIKSLNLLYNVMAKQKANENGSYEAILYRNENHITEGSSSNFFGVRDGKVITHPANNYILNGITRLAVKKVCEQLDIPFEEKVFGIPDLETLDEAFISSTTAEIVSVIQIDEKKIGNGQVGPIVKQLQEGFLQLID
jgi:D-alanine transaminase